MFLLFMNDLPYLELADDNNFVIYADEILI